MLVIRYPIKVLDQGRPLTNGGVGVLSDDITYALYPSSLYVKGICIEVSQGVCFQLVDNSLLCWVRESSTSCALFTSGIYIVGH